MRTGAAAAPESDEITIDRLHQYVSRKVQAESPAMVPKIFAKGEGYQLRIAKIALGDPSIQYRKQVERLIQQFGEPIKSLARAKLTLLQKKLQLSADQVIEIEKKVLEPIRERKEKLLEYRKIFAEALLDEYPLDDQHLQLLSEIRTLLGFEAEDVAIVEAEVLAEVQPELLTKESIVIEFDRLEELLRKQEWKAANHGHLPHWRQLISGWGVSDRGISFLKRGLDCSIGALEVSEAEDVEVESIAPPTSEVTFFKGDLGGSGTETKPIDLPILQPAIIVNGLETIDYSKLQELLKNKQWKKADQETYDVMLSALGRQGIKVRDLKSYPEDTIKKIDH